MKWIFTPPNFLLIIFSFLAVIVLSPILAISLGLIYSLLYKNISQEISKKVSTIPLQIGIVLLGFTISMATLINIIDAYAIWVLFFIIFSFVLSFILGKSFGLDTKLNILLASGLSICGATAIAIIGPLIKANTKFIFISLAILFSFNALAIILFPMLGDLLNMSNYEFGVFSALAIHDTGSVVGSALAFSNPSVEVATSLKVLRTLGLIPLILLLNYRFNANKNSFVFPKFIIYFFVALGVANIYELSYSSIEYLK
ncbi:MAG: putative sulfate exporter family transporter, partial [Proteobacteria bacterium]|nr:putative sulfate exporter family transporter [Pseudomonadota bacterium]